MGSFLGKPYKDTDRGKGKIISLAVFGLFIFLFLFLFKPFGFSQLDTSRQFFISLGFGLITFFVLIVFKFLIEPAVIGDNWTIGRNILWDILISSSIGAANYFYMCVIFKMDFNFLYLLYSMWTAILVGSIPVTITYFIKYNRMYRNALKEADIPEEKIMWADEITITAGYPKNDFRINPKNIVYLCSNDNYVTITTINDNIQNKTTIRGTLKSAEEELKKNSRFVRCHKCYIVNLDFVEKVTGNNQNMRIRLTPSLTEIPVARSKADEVTRRIGRK
jgi:LytTr DNA-binding domain